MGNFLSTYLLAQHSLRCCSANNDERFISAKRRRRKKRKNEISDHDLTEWQNARIASFTVIDGKCRTNPRVVLVDSFQINSHKFVGVSAFTVCHSTIHTNSSHNEI